MATVQRHTLQNLGPIHPPQVDQRAIKPSLARHVKVPVRDPLDHEAPAILHEPRSYNAMQANGAAVILVSGAGGGVSGPSGIYPSLADKLALLISIPCIRLDYRQPAQSDYCPANIVASMDDLAQQYNSSRFVVIGWSFGGSPVITAAAKETERIRGVVTVGSQTAKTEGISQLSPRPLLLLHGAGDRALSPACSQSLYRQYGTEGQREIKLFPADGHGLSGHAPEAEGMILAFAARTLGFEKLLDYETMNQAKGDLVESGEERKREMETRHDLEGGERIN